MFQTYEQWKEALPDTKFLEGILPTQEELDAVRSSLISYRDKIKDAVPDFTLGNITLGLHHQWNMLVCQMRLLVMYILMVTLRLMLIKYKYLRSI